MMQISFSWTTPALFVEDLALRKSETRRDWKAKHAAKFRNGALVQAWDKQARFGGKKVAIIRLTRDPYQEPLCDIPGNAWYREGFEYLQRMCLRVDGVTPWELWSSWKLSDETMWVVEFELVQDLREDIQATEYATPLMVFK
uniref:ASCH domain-containing protein n=1 Tax=viral metagenome TaxID=1070528 RepID=A0A6M3LUL9_9ZZZZ